MSAEPPWPCKLYLYAIVVNPSSPAIVTQESVRPLPRLAVVLFCLAYVLPGFWFRESWKSVDLTSLGFMLSLAQGGSDWWHPTFMGQNPELYALFPYWIGALFIRACSGLLDPAHAARVPFLALTLTALCAHWYASYYLAKGQRAQPVPFAFGGQASEQDYAKAIADAGLLALLATLGLAQPTHEATPMLAQWCFVSLAFYASAVLPFQPRLGALTWGLALLGMSFSGAPTLALLMGVGACVLIVLDSSLDHPKTWGLKFLAIALGVALLCPKDLWQWRLILPPTQWAQWHGLLRLGLWFTWPAWPLALWTLWRWRGHWLVWQWSRHVVIPLFFASLFVLGAVTSVPAERILLLSLPALATLAAFALPTLERSVSALIDWFTLIFFSGCAFIIWVVWLAMQTGWPTQPAANVKRLLPGFEPDFGLAAFALALMATITWVALVHWRAGQHRKALWKSLVLPASGASLCWLLLMSLWLPLLDYARSYKPLVYQVTQLVEPDRCLQVQGLSLAQISAFKLHSGLLIEAAQEAPDQTCPWLLVESLQNNEQAIQEEKKLGWSLVQTLHRSYLDNEDMDVFKRVKPATPDPSTMGSPPRAHTLKHQLKRAP